MAVPGFLHQEMYRNAFIQGWDRYVALDSRFGMGTSPPTDVYWNPRVGEWQTFDQPTWRILDEDLPSVAVSFLANAENIYAEITSQFTQMTTQHQQTAVWDGRRHGWMLAQRFPPPTMPGTCRHDTKKS